MRATTPTLLDTCATAARAIAMALALGGAGEALAADGDIPPRPPADLPLDLFDVEGRTHFQFITRWTPATGAHVWHLDAGAAFQVTDGLAIILGVPTAIAAPQASGIDDRFALGNLKLGVGGGTSFTVRRGPEVGDAHIGVRIGGAFDTYFPTAPIPDEDRATALLALHYRPLEPGLWAGRALAFRARGHVGVAGRRWSVDGEVGLTPAFTLGSNSDAWIWVTLVTRARVVLAHVFEPFLELGGTLTAASPRAGLLATAFDAAGFQITPGVRFHFGEFSPALFVAIQPDDDFGKVTVGIDIAGGTTRSHRRSVESDDLDF